MNIDLKLEFPQKILQSSKKEPTNESLLILRSYNEQLKEELTEKEERLSYLKNEKAKHECEIKSLQCSVDVKSKEIEKEKLLLQTDHNVENEWKEQVEVHAKKKLTSLQEFQSKMAEYRKELFSSVVFNAELVTQEMNEIILKQESVIEDIQKIETILREMEKNSYTVDEVINEDNKNLTILTEELQAVKHTKEKEIEEFEKEEVQLDEELKKLSVV